MRRLWSAGYSMAMIMSVRRVAIRSRLMFATAGELTVDAAENC
jgi:hypothetical protein